MRHEHHHSHSLAGIFTAVLIFAAGMLLNLPEKAEFTIFLVAYLAAGWKVLLTAFKNIFKGKLFDENFLMGVAALGAFGIGEYPEGVMVIILYRLGEFLQDKAVEKSRKSITELMDIRPDSANVLEKTGVLRKTPDEVNIGDLILVKPGEKIPLDGTVEEGHAYIDTSALTGEAAVRELNIGDCAISGCINTNGVLKIRVTKLFGESTVSEILKLVESAEEKKAKQENFITKFAKYYTPAVVFCALFLALIPPVVTGSAFDVWIMRSLTFLVISCPCALVISIPLGFFAGIGAASRKGILVKGSCCIENLSKPYAIVFDKTGTLTKGSFRVIEVVPAEGYSKETLLEYAASAEKHSNHPIALSLKTAYGKDTDDYEGEIRETAGLGIQAQIRGMTVLAGNYELMKRFNIDCKESETEGTIVHVSIGGKYAGYIVISDEIKDDAAKAICELKKYAERILMLTGDSPEAAEYTAQKIGIKEFYAGLMPEHKVFKLEEIIDQKTGSESVIFAGDGINDAPVITRADIGIAMGVLGSDAAIETADIVIMDDKLTKIADAVKIAKKTIRIVTQNIIFAIGVKFLFLVLGAFGFMTMLGAVFADSGVALLAILNSMRLML